MNRPGYFSRILLLIIVVAGFVFHPLAGIQANKEWKSYMESLLNEFMQCNAPIDDYSPCNRFLGLALKRVYKINDFERPQQSGQYMSANEIALEVSKSKQWILLGKAENQEVLSTAQDNANSFLAVIAVNQGEPNAHVALVLPGELQESNNWKKLKVPNSASFKLNDSASSYVGRKLSYAFSSPDKVLIYSRLF
jgi:hypothetical protein